MPIFFSYCAAHTEQWPAAPAVKPPSVTLKQSSSREKRSELDLCGTTLQTVIGSEAKEPHNSHLPPKTPPCQFCTTLQREAVEA